MKKVSNGVLLVEILTVTIETLKADLVGIKTALNNAEKLGADFVIKTINASLTSEDLKSLFGECKKILTESYAKKVCGAINIGYNLGVKNDAEKMAILSTKGFNNLYSQLREWKNGKKEIIDSTQAVKVKGQNVTQKRIDKKGAENTSQNHMENAIVKSASLADVMDLLTSLSDMALSQKDDKKIIDFIASTLLSLENTVYEMTA